MRRLVIALLFLLIPMGVLHAQTPGWTTFSGGEMTIQAPQSWADYQDAATDPVSISRRFPELADLLADYTVPYEYASLDLLLYDVKFGTAMSGAAVEAGASEVFAEITQNSLTAGQTLASTEALKNGIKLVFEGTEGALNTQAHYILEVDDAVYVLTFTTGADNFAASEATFDEMVATFQVGETEVASTTGEDVVDTSDWVNYSTENISINVPSNWVTIEDEAAFEAALDLITEQNPDFAATAELVRQQIASGAMDLFVIEPLTGNNLNVIVVDVGMDFPLDLFQDQLEVQYSAMEGIEMIGSEFREFEAGEALVVELDNQMIPGIKQVQYQYVFSANNKAYIITTTSSEATAEMFAPIFEEVMKSLVILQ